MSKKINEHVLYYISLVIIFALGSLLISSVAPNKLLQLLIFILIAVFYVIWGILHHLINHEITSKIVVEYILIGVLGIAIMFFLLKGGFGI
jgi:lipopolysaccharide export LptBFGC system permease protein LptF